MRKRASVYATVLVLLVTLSLSLLTSCGEATFTHAEYSISLPSDYDYLEDTDGVYDIAMSNGEAIIGVSRLSFVAADKTGIDISMMPSQFAAYYKAVSKVDSTLEMTGDVPYYVYYLDKGGVKYTVLIAFHRSKHAYFTTTFTVRADAERRYISEFIDYADNVIFDSKN